MTAADEQHVTHGGSSIRFWSSGKSRRVSLLVHERTSQADLDAMVDRAERLWTRLTTQERARSRAAPVERDLDALQAAVPDREGDIPWPT